MNTTEWADLAGETEMEKDIVNRVCSYSFSMLINEHVDYEMLFDITDFADGTRKVDIVGEHIVLFDTDGAIVETIEAYLPKDKRNELIQMAEQYEF